MPPLLPDCPTREAFHALVERPEPWLPVVRELAARHGLPAPVPADHRPAGTVVFLLGDHVLKLTPRWWERELDAEAATLPLVAGRLGIASPLLVARGEIEDWPYIVITRLPGSALDLRKSAGPVEERCAIAAAAGEALARMHALPTGPFAGLPVHAGAFEAHRREVAPACQRAWGLPGPLVDELPGWLEVTGPLLGGDYRPVPVHADLHHQNLLVEERDGRRIATGIVDFGDAALGPPEFDLGVPALFLGRGDPAVLDALFSGYGRPGARRDPGFRRRLLAWMFLHPFGNMARFVSRGEGRTPRATMAEFEADLLPG